MFPDQLKPLVKLPPVSEWQKQNLAKFRPCPGSEVVKVDPNKSSRSKNDNLAPAANQEQQPDTFILAKNPATVSSTTDGQMILIPKQMVSTPERPQTFVPETNFDFGFTHERLQNDSLKTGDFLQLTINEFGGKKFQKVSALTIFRHEKMK